MRTVRMRQTLHQHNMALTVSRRTAKWTEGAERRGDRAPPWCGRNRSTLPAVIAVAKRHASTALAVPLESLLRLRRAQSIRCSDIATETVHACPLHHGLAPHQLP